MEILITMFVREKDEYGRLPAFRLLGFYPGAIKNKTRMKDCWLEWMDDKSVLPVDRLMDRAFQMNQLTIFKEPDNVTQKLILANQNKTRLDGQFYVSIKFKEKSSLWQGSYNFDFFVEQMLANQSDGDGNRWEQLQLKIIDKTESIELPE